DLPVPAAPPARGHRRARIPRARPRALGGRRRTRAGAHRGRPRPPRRRVGPVHPVRAGRWLVDRGLRAAVPRPPEPRLPDHARRGHRRVLRPRQRAAPPADLPRRRADRLAGDPDRGRWRVAVRPGRDQRRPRLAGLRHRRGPRRAADHPGRRRHRFHRADPVRRTALDLPPDGGRRRSV
ncbi:MAG: hypothetical protein AVDCRST_MAG52-2280, partial [uncultured Blastococcus sp.]